MTAESSWITYILQIVRNSNVANMDKVNLYLFGSSLREAKPKDIDLLIVYQKESINIDRLLALKRTFKSLLEDVIKLNVDICLLSVLELEQSQFADEEKAVLLTSNI